MHKVRTALAMASLEQYLGLVVNFVMVAALSRLLAPAEIGLGVVGAGICTIVFSLREFATSEFLIQQPQVREPDIRTAFTVVFAVSAALALALWLAAPALAAFYRDERLTAFIFYCLLAALADACAAPTVALLRRDMAFATLAWIRTASSLANAAAAITLAFLGHGFVSMAIGTLVGSLATALLALAARPHLSQFRPSLASWRALSDFGRYKGGSTVVDQVYVSLPQLLLGRILPMSDVGIYNRATTICNIPDRVLLSAVFAIAFPALSAALREGRDMKEAYLRTLAHIGAAYWPALLLVALLADPIVHTVLGPRWTETVPLVRIMALAALFWFPAILTFPILAAVGANRDAFVASAISRTAAALLLCGSSFFGLTVMALAQFVSLPFQTAVSLRYVSARIPFSRRELAAALLPSLLAALAAMTGPLAVLAWNGFDLDMPLGLALAAAALAAPGWLAGLAATGHPLLAELDHARLAMLNRFMPRAASPAPPGAS
jgi:O-antigen/teichoic acid export membrane protein